MIKIEPGDEEIGLMTSLLVTIMPNARHLNHENC
jgi:hypothetical protein